MANDFKICDHTSVGILVWRKDELLLIERGVLPTGFAPPAGHVDNHGSYEDAAKAELKEETGLTALNLKLLLKGRVSNICSREDGTYHDWKIYEAETKGKLKRSKRETKQAGWYSKEEIKKLMERTEKYFEGEISEEKWEKNPGIEPVWYDFFKDLDIA